jgi:hypothetical protein
MTGRILSNTPAALPQAASHYELPRYEVVEEPDDVPQSIAGLMCVIEYVDSCGAQTERLVTCRRYDLRGNVGYVGAISANGYVQFRTDRILAVSDLQTGEVLGDGTFFARFDPNSIAEAVETFGLPPSRKAHLVAGLNILTFMARCDGHWHPLESEPIEQFICSLWLRKEWDGDPPIDKIMAHARRIAPDGQVFIKSIKQYAQSSTSSRLIRRAVEAVIAADGIICDAEHLFAMELVAQLDESTPKPPGFDEIFL